MLNTYIRYLCKKLGSGCRNKRHDVAKQTIHTLIVHILAQLRSLCIYLFQTYAYALLSPNHISRTR
ncbi:hypothetical protein DL89DRAFT_265969 [Linderina pennispora]|uniref:Uncharacterized protein n=1 Tax=Linderina pennispora TaxID=61395 RepID=A0A1Y1WFZ1_9FUNG|nr:uncharacterized protein DL89DRAFT_265965 [Linderina pennispora]XP_040745834.1 uncharacterized protein DL89DRAFT_265969 [Linderina pennispora]ORX72402.1 hypothetical protein DL89DRAFT_265965 [Linderina pennispora]ORX72410.1 hypothetical protein DL89DRAFT_265969 [Linderina pennispora]